MALPKEWEEKVIQAFEKAEYQEIFGLNFSKEPQSWTKAHENVLMKFYIANEKRVAESYTQLLKTLKWRKEFKPLEAAKEQFDGPISQLGVVTKSPVDKKVVTWNLYGAIKNPKEVFNELDTFIRWRVGLHERALAELDFADEKLSTMDQVHDYMGVSFLRMDSNVKKASSKVIELFQSYYPETLSSKYFVNVPYIMMWVFKLVRGLTPEATTAKFHVLANGDQLASEMGNWVPKEYGGKAASLKALAISKDKSEDNDVE